MRYITAGESHGKALTGIFEGCPSGLALSKEEIQNELFRRKKGYGRGDRQKIETEDIEILSGVRFGKTLGSPIALLIENKDWANWEKTMSTEGIETSDREVLVPRPGHADYVGALKYDHADMRNVLERASARETAMRVAVATVARKFLSELNIQVLSRVVQIGKNKDTTSWPAYTSELSNLIDSSPVRCLDSVVEKSIMEEIEVCAKEGDTLGGIFETVAFNLPIGLGSYTQWNHRIEGKLAQIFMSLNAIKGVEIGEGFTSGTVRGSKAHDEITLKENKDGIDYKTNRSGGITGGMTTGQPLLVRAAMKPLSTLKKPLRSISMKDKSQQSAHFERSDVCAVPSAAVIGESLMCLVIMEEVLKKFGGDSMTEIKTRYKDWLELERSKFS
ncbi:MAG: chorismate synthase [Bdellovibrionota bacterium]